MLAKKKMSKKKNTILVSILVVMIIGTFAVSYNTFWKKSKFEPGPLGDYSADMATDPALKQWTGEPGAYSPFEIEPEIAETTKKGQLSKQSSSPGEFNLEFFESELFKNLKSYVDLPIKLDPKKVGNPNPFFVPPEEEEEEEEEE